MRFTVKLDGKTIVTKVSLENLALVLAVITESVGGWLRRSEWQDRSDAKDIAMLASHYTTTTTFIYDDEHFRLNHIGQICITLEQ